MGYSTINFKSKDILYAHQLNVMDSQILTNDTKLLYLDGEIKKVAANVNIIPSWAKQESKPTYSAAEVGTYTQQEIDAKIQNLTGINLSNYYTKTEVDNLIPKDYIVQSTLNNYAPLSVLSDYVTLSHLSDQYYVTSSALNSRNYATKDYVTQEINKVAFEGVNLDDYLMVDDAEGLIDLKLQDYVTTLTLESDYYTKEEVENLVLGGSLQDEITNREQGDAELQEQINGLVIVKNEDGDYQLIDSSESVRGDVIIVPQEKIYDTGIVLTEDNHVQLLLSDDEVTKANLAIDNNGALKFIGQDEILGVVSGYTINGHQISTNPTLNTSDIKLSENGQLFGTDDSVTDALLKLDEIINWESI